MTNGNKHANDSLPERFPILKGYTLQPTLGLGNLRDYLGS